MECARSVHTLGDKHDADKTFRFRHLDGEAGGQDEESAYYDELLMKSKHITSRDMIPTSPMTRTYDQKFAWTRWADIDSEDYGLGVSAEIPARSESRRRAELCAEGWL